MAHNFHSKRFEKKSSFTGSYHESDFHFANACENVDCNVKFTFGGRHHCRACGSSVCKKHCIENVVLTSIVNGIPMNFDKVCSICVDQHGHDEAMKNGMAIKIQSLWRKHYICLTICDSLVTDGSSRRLHSFEKSMSFLTQLIGDDDQENSAIDSSIDASTRPSMTVEELVNSLLADHDHTQSANVTSDNNDKESDTNHHTPTATTVDQSDTHHKEQGPSATYDAMSTSSALLSAETPDTHINTYSSEESEPEFEQTAFTTCASSMEIVSSPANTKLVVAPPSIAPLQEIESQQAVVVLSQQSVSADVVDQLTVSEMPVAAHHDSHSDTTIKLSSLLTEELETLTELSSSFYIPRPTTASQITDNITSDQEDSLCFAPYTDHAQHALSTLVSHFAVSCDQDEEDEAMRPYLHHTPREGGGGGGGAAAGEEEGEERVNRANRVPFTPVNRSYVESDDEDDDDDDDEEEMYTPDVTMVVRHRTNTIVNNDNHNHYKYENNDDHYNNDSDSRTSCLDITIHCAVPTIQLPPIEQTTNNSNKTRQGPVGIYVDIEDINGFVSSSGSGKTPEIEPFVMCVFDFNTWWWFAVPQPAAVVI